MSDNSLVLVQTNAISFIISAAAAAAAAAADAGYGGDRPLLSDRCWRNGSVAWEQRDGPFLCAESVAEDDISNLCQQADGAGGGGGQIGAAALGFSGRPAGRPADEGRRGSALGAGNSAPPSRFGAGSAASSADSEAHRRGVLGLASGGPCGAGDSDGRARGANGPSLPAAGGADAAGAFCAPAPAWAWEAAAGPGGEDPFRADWAGWADGGAVRVGADGGAGPLLCEVRGGRA